MFDAQQSNAQGGDVIDQLQQIQQFMAQQTGQQETPAPMDNMQLGVSKSDE